MNRTWHKRFGWAKPHESVVPRCMVCRDPLIDARANRDICHRPYCQGFDDAMLLVEQHENVDAAEEP